MHAFISHSSKDAEFAFHVVRILEANGLKCWIAPRDIPVGSDYASEILQALQSARCVALLFSEHANGSPHVLREVERAISYRRPILPLMTDRSVPEGSFAYFLATLHTPKLPASTVQNAAETYARVVGDFVAGHLAQTSPPPPRSVSLSEAYDALWQMTTDLELKYRRACREKVGEEEWISIGAIQVTINEFLIANRQHFPEELRKATQAYSKSVERLAKAAKLAEDSEAAEDFANTSIISGDVVNLGRELYEANQRFEQCARDFDLAFKTCRKPKGLWQKLFRGA